VKTTCARVVLNSSSTCVWSGERRVFHSSSTTAATKNTVLVDMSHHLFCSCLLLLPRCVVSAEVFHESTPLTSNPLPALRHSSILSTIGSTPVVKLQHMAPPGVDVYVKVESFNPMGSIKDRMALGMIEYAEHHGLLKPGQTVVEATSGNTGLGLAMVCAAKGYPFVCIMSEAFSIERRKMMRFLGAKVVLTNPDGV
jgi:threonine synthase